MEAIIEKVLVVLVNVIQLVLVIMIGLAFDCIIEITFLSFFFWVLRAILPTRHFGIFLCTTLTLFYYVISCFIIINLYFIKFIPLLLALFLVIIMKKKE